LENDHKLTASQRGLPQCFVYGHMGGAWAELGLPQPVCFRH